MESNTKHKPTIFLSYSWRDFEIADKIEADFKNAGIEMIRDIRMDYKDSIPKFMERISKEDYAILLISESYLRSSNCMYEVLDLLEYKRYEDKILPIILPNTNIFRPEDHIGLIKFWENKIIELNKNVRELSSVANINEIIESINHFTKIRNSISDFISTIKALNCKSFEELNSQNYKQILDLIGIEQEDLAAMILNLTHISNIEEREIQIDKYLEKYPKNGNLLFLKANIAFSEKKYQKAQNHFLRLIEKNPKVSILYNNLGLCYWSQDLLNKAMEAFNMAITIDPNDGVAYCNLGLLFKEKFNDNENAKINYELSLKKDNLSSESHYNYALLLCEMHDYEKAKYHYEEALKIYPKIPSPERVANIHFGLANLLFNELKDFENARLQYECCISIDNQHFKAHCNYAVLLRTKLQDYDKARFHYEKALEIEPKDIITLTNLGNLHAQNLKNAELAKFYYLKVIKFDEKNFGALFGLGNITHDESPNESKTYYERALNVNSNTPFIHMAYALLLKKHYHQHELAKKHYSISIELDPKLETTAYNILFG